MIAESPLKPTTSLFAGDRMRGIALALFTAAGLWICFRLTLPFLPAIAWSLALAVAAVPMQRGLEARLGRRRNLAATISVVMIALVVIAPALFVAERLVAEAAKGADTISSSVQSGTWRAAFSSHPALASIGEWFERQLDVSGVVASLTGSLTNVSASLVRGSIEQLFGVLLTFYLLFYFLRDREAILALARDLSPLAAPEMDRLFQSVVDTVNATIYGTVAVAAVQGVLGGLMFWWLGLPGALVWGLVMGLLAVVPVLGAFVVWVPAAVVLALGGRWVAAATLGLWGLVVIGGIDNLLYPVLVGNRLRLHTAPALIAIVGGVAVFGASGVILGPLAVAATASLLEIGRARTRDSGADGVEVP